MLYVIICFILYLIIFYFINETVTALLRTPINNQSHPQNRHINELLTNYSVHVVNHTPIKTIKLMFQPAGCIYLKRYKNDWFALIWRRISQLFITNNWLLSAIQYLRSNHPLHSVKSVVFIAVCCLVIGGNDSHVSRFQRVCPLRPLITLL